MWQVRDKFRVANDLMTGRLMYPEKQIHKRLR